MTGVKDNFGINPNPLALLSYVINKTLNKMTIEFDSTKMSFEYFPAVTSTQNFPEITVTVGFRIGLKPVQSFAGYTHPIQNDDQTAMEAASFYEAAQKAWTTKYGLGGVEEETANFVKREIEKKWAELNRENETPRELEFLTSDKI